MKKYCFIFLCCIFFTLSNTFGQTRKVSSLNASWSFHKGALTIDDVESPSNSWEIVNTPHTWNDKDVLADHKRSNYRVEGWYKKPLKGKFDISHKNYFIHFEGAGQYAELYVNGHKVGDHTGGYTAFTFDITFFLKPTDNNIVVRVDNSYNPDIPPLSADFTFFGGIYRDVFLIETSKSHFNLLDYGSKGVFVSTPQVNDQQASVKIRGSISTPVKRNKDLSLRYIVRDHNKNIVSDTKEKVKVRNEEVVAFEASAITLKQPQLWSPDSPYLYTLEVQLLEKGNVVDEEHIPFGIRTFKFDANEGFILNGKPLRLIGANRHQDYQGMGNALSDDQHRSDLALLKEMGGNFIRLAHYPQDPAVLEQADKLGLLVWEEIPLVNEVTRSKAHNKNSANMLKEMIRQHYNHPSVILWGYMNEIYWAHRFIDKEIVDLQTEWTVNLAKELEAIARKEDPTRYTAMALHNYPLYEETDLGSIPQVVGWNLYHGWYYDKFEDFGKFMDEQHQKHPERIHIISEYGAGSDPRLHSTKPERFDFTIEGQKRFLESFLQQIIERPYIAGATVWNLIDFSSERRIDTNPRLNNKGLATSDRKPKDPYFYFQAYLSQSPYIKIAETNWTERSHYPERAASKNSLPVQVYTNLDEVELFQNNRSLGTKKTINNMITWDVNFEEGANRFKAISPAGGQATEDFITINYKEVPFDLTEVSQIDISVNVGSNHSFYDEKGKTTWVVDKPYEKGSWGYIGGQPLYIARKIGTKEHILTVEDFIPLYQTMQQGIEQYQFDVMDGWYELELLFVEPIPKSRRFVEGIESPEHEGGLRIFNVQVNDWEVYEALDLLKEFGYNYPLRKKVKIKAQNGSGVTVKLEAIKGKTILSAIKIRSL